MNLSEISHLLNETELTSDKLQDVAMHVGQGLALAGESVHKILVWYKNERARPQNLSRVDDAFEFVIHGYTRELANRALVDPVTGLANRRAFEMALSTEVERAKRYDRQIAFIIADIDDFKRINDTRGHPEGDRLLATVADVLAKTLRRTDRVFRYGGDEFVAICPETSSSTIVGALWRVEDNLKGVDDGNVSISWGVSTLPEDGKDGASLIGIADQRLYSMKRSRKQ
jgi:diguanylate cyclase (GGDEF)-like protein